jgi:hypothetical protein
MNTDRCHPLAWASVETDAPGGEHLGMSANGT